LFRIVVLPKLVHVQLTRSVSVRALVPQISESLTEGESAVPSSGNFVAVKLISVVAEDPRKSKVGDLELPGATDQQICRFEVAMHDMVRVTESDAFQQHQHVTLYLHNSDS